MASNRIKLQIARRIGEILSEKGWSQAKLGREIGSPRSYITKIMNCEANLTLDTIAKIEEVTGHPILNVVGDNV